MILYYFAAVLIGACFVIFVLFGKQPFDIDIFTAAPIEDPENAVYQFHCLSFELLTVIEVKVGGENIVFIKEIHVRFAVSILLKSFGKFGVT